MINLVKMDLYRMVRAKSFWVCLILAFVCAFGQMPFAWGLSMLGRMFGSDQMTLQTTTMWSEIIEDAFPLLNAVLLLLSANAFFYADIENGYIKNIAGQMPRRGFAVFSKFIAAIPHNLLFMIVGVTGNLLGTILFTKLGTDGHELNSLLAFVLKLLLIQSLCAILLMATNAFRSKSLGSVLAVLLGTGMMFLLYGGITSAVNQVFHFENFSLGSYMPDQLIASPADKPWRSILSAVITTALFLQITVHIFDRKDVK